MKIENENVYKIKVGMKKKRYHKNEVLEYDVRTIKLVLTMIE